MSEESQKKGCPKCGGTETAESEIAATGTGLSKIFDVQHNQFKVISCTKCGYSEFYNLKHSRGMDVLDFFFGG